MPTKYKLLIGSGILGVLSLAALVISCWHFYANYKALRNNSSYIYYFPKYNF